jgi:hypothetical protein
MNSVEDQVRAATRAEAATMREVRPLRLPPAPGAAPARRPAFRTRRWRGWMVPITAAVAVVAVAIALVIVRDISNGPVVPATGPALAPTVPPQYYVAVSGTPVGWYAYAPLTGENNIPPNDLVVGDTVTGQKLATLAAPAGTEWAGVTAAADDRTFAAFAEPAADRPGLAGRWYLVRLTPGAASPAKLTQLPIEPLSDVGAMALSRSGKELAIVIAASQSERNPNQTGEKSLCVYSVATGDLVHHCWSTDTTENKTFFFYGGYQPGQLNPSLTWIDGDNAIAFPASEAVQIPHSKHFEGRQTVRRLDLTAKGTSLAADSKIIWSETLPPRTNPLCGSASPVVSADGKTVLCATYTQLTGRNYPWRLAWLAFPTSASAHPGGRPVTDYQLTMRVPWQTPGSVPPLWVARSGSVLLVAWQLEKNGRDFTHFGVISGGKFTALPVPSAIVASPSRLFTDITTAIAW